ncbi:MAG: hypothetical protein LBQ42_01030 [Synergistaceae bacterium]|jgi:hypothetical protein|nr:hypothetical protein [Synergistaceae bacterium]
MEKKRWVLGILLSIFVSIFCSAAYGVNNISGMSSPFGKIEKQLIVNLNDLNRTQAPTADYPLPCREEGSWSHSEGSSGHGVFGGYYPVPVRVTYSENTEAVNDTTDYYNMHGYKKSDLFALDLNLPDDADSGKDVKPIASGFVRRVSLPDGYVEIQHDSPLGTGYSQIDDHTRNDDGSNVWFTGYMHMAIDEAIKKLAWDEVNKTSYTYSGGEKTTVTIETVLGTVSSENASKARMPNHLHFAVYDKSGYSFSPWFLGSNYQAINYTCGEDGRLPNCYHEGDSDNQELQLYPWVTRYWKYPKDPTRSNDKNKEVREKYEHNADYWYPDYPIGRVENENPTPDPEPTGGTLTQVGYKDFSQYSYLTNFDMDQNSDLYVITNKDTAATLVRFDNNGVKLREYPATNGVGSLTVSPTGNVAFYRVGGEKVYRNDLKNLTEGMKDTFTYNGSNIDVRQVKAIDDDLVLLTWVSEYDDKDWLPKTIMVGRFRFSAGGEPEKTWRWSPQWQASEVKYNSPFGNSWSFGIGYNATTKEIMGSTYHKIKFNYSPNSRVHYSTYATHHYKNEDTVSAMVEVPRTSFPNWKDNFLDPRFSSAGVETYYEHDNYNGNVNFPIKIYMADQFTNALIDSEYVESWEGKNGKTSFQDTWKREISGNFSFITEYFTDYQNNFYVLSGITNLDTSATRELDFIKFESSRSNKPGTPDPSQQNAVHDADKNITLRVSAYQPPSGYTQVGSKWEVWKKDEVNDSSNKSKAAVDNIVYEKEILGTGSECIIPAGTFGEGQYEWRMSYKWRDSRYNEGYTTWSEMVNMTVKAVPTTPENPETPETPETVTIDLSDLNLQGNVLTVELGEWIDATLASNPAGAIFNATSLPVGLTLDSDGHLYGSISIDGLHTVEVTATLNDLKQTASFMIDVQPDEIVTPIPTPTPTPTPTPAPSNKSGSGGGCSAFGLGVGVLVLAGAALLRKSGKR